MTIDAIDPNYSSAFPVMPSVRWAVLCQVTWTTDQADLQQGFVRSDQGTQGSRSGHRDKLNGREVTTQAATEGQAGVGPRGWS